MGQISAVGGVRFNSTWAINRFSPAISPSSAGNSPWASPPSDSAIIALLGSGPGDQHLLAMDAAGAVTSTRTGNALATASDAMDVVGGLFSGIDSVLASANAADAAYSPKTDFNAVADQGRIDCALATIDAIATSSRFGGKPLLDGSFSVQDSGATLTIPSFLSTALGTATGTATSSSVSSLASNGPNDLASGNFPVAKQIVDTALAQVDAARSAIVDYRNTVLGPDLASSRLALASLAGHRPATDTMFLYAAEMLADPRTALAATANSTPSRVLDLLWR